MARGRGRGRRDHRVSPRQGAEDELTRVLALVPWIIAHPGSTKDEIAQRFGISVSELERDLWLLMMVGVPPYSPGDYIDVDPESDTVEIRLADYFTRPLRLSPAEGLALLAAGRALLAVPGSDSSGPLATAIGKLAHALEGVDVVVDFGEPAFLDEVREAARAGRRIEIEYWSAGRDHRSTAPDRPRTAVLRGGAVVHRRVLPPGGRQPHVPPRPHPRRPPDRRDVRPRRRRRRRAARGLHRVGATTSGSRSTCPRARPGWPRRPRWTRWRTSPTAANASCSRSARPPGSSDCCSRSGRRRGSSTHRSCGTCPSGRRGACSTRYAGDARAPAPPSA